MAVERIPEHIHAFPRLSAGTILPVGVATWDETNNILYVGDGKEQNGLPFVSNCLPQEISKSFKDDNGVFINVSSKYIPYMLKINNIGKFYTIRGEDLSLNENEFTIDISNALAKNGLSEFSGIWTVYFNGLAWLQINFHLKK